MNAQFHRFAREELVPGLAFVPTYGNTLMGLACPKPFDPADAYAITYYPPQPRAVIELVDPKDPSRKVGYGETGQVMLTTLTKEFSCPASSSATRPNAPRPSMRILGTASKTCAC